MAAQPSTRVLSQSYSRTLGRGTPWRLRALNGERS
jgi:hypothetical protein